MAEAADTVEMDPDRLSFTRTLHVIRRITDPAELGHRRPLPARGIPRRGFQGGHRSTVTRTTPRDTQMAIESLRWASVRQRSRCSTSPPSTRTGQVPQKPCWQE